MRMLRGVRRQAVRGVPTGGLLLEGVSEEGLEEPQEERVPQERKDRGGRRHRRQGGQGGGAGEPRPRAGGLRHGRHPLRGAGLLL